MALDHYTPGFRLIDGEQLNDMVDVVNNLSGGGTAGPVTASTVTASTSATVGSAGTAITQIKVYTPALDVASVAANTSAEQTFTVTGLTTADKVIVNIPSTLNNGLGLVGARVSAADTLALRFSNSTAGALDPASATFAVIAIRS